MNIVLEICLVPPFLQGRWKHESKMVLRCHSWLQFLMVNSSGEIQSVLFLKSSFGTETTFLPACSSLLSIFLLCHFWLADKLCPYKEKFCSRGITSLCWSVRNCQSHRVVPVPLGFCWSPKMFPLLLICCKVPPQHQRSPVSIVSGVCTLLKHHLSVLSLGKLGQWCLLASWRGGYEQNIHACEN